jgi:aromatase
MLQQTHREVEHHVTVQASADQVYQLIVAVQDWPHIFPPTVHAEVIESGGDWERIRIWATANGEVKNWTSRRELDASVRRIHFKAEVFRHPVAEMSGTWLVEEQAGGGCLVRLLHAYRAVADDPDNLAWIDKATDENSRSELGALKAAAEAASSSQSPLLTFEDRVRVDGSARDVYDFLNEAQLWRDRLPHVMRVSLQEETPGIQVLEMDTKTKDGSAHTTKSVRVCLPHASIIYKQTTLPPLMLVHTGRWQIDERPGGVDVTSRHTVVINEAVIGKFLGETAGLAEAKQFVRNALSGNSMATLEHARQYAESRR